MRLSIPIAALWLTRLPGVLALDGALLRQLAELADQGLNADGTPILTSDEEESFSAFSVSSSDTENIVAEYVELPLDNFAKNGDFSYEGTFWNRYWVKEGAYRPGGPVFLYDVGEGDAEPYWRGRLESETSWFRQMVEEFGGVGIVWEHRFYGNSTPGGIDIYTPPEVFQRLTTAQSLADIDRFANQFSRKNINYTLTPDKTPWIMVGGSYPAMRAAFMRDRYPDTIFAAFASSAPVEAKIDMSGYWDPIVRGMRRYGFGNCTNDVIASISYIDKQLDRPSTAAALKKKFLGLGAEKTANADFADALSYTFSTWQSYGMEGSPYSLRKFCDHMSYDPETKKTAGADGWAKKKGVKWSVDRWAKWPYFVGMTNQYLDTNCSGNEEVEGNCELDYVVRSPAGIAWSWQYCTEWGYFQSANLGPNQIVSKYSSLTHWHDMCHRQFPTATPPLFPDWPATARTNAQFGGWHIRPSQVYWSGGEFDPWRTLSPMSAESWAPRVRESPSAPACGQKGGAGELFGYLLRDAQHCYDFRVGVKEGERSRGIWGEALRKWLKCFKPRKGRGKGRGREWKA
ncbi:peptidase S28 [Lentithecium fluviatile CBS 122367]|uniref:Peptidase S28 n=1 Tax=Lentithecium fluviatile CBS 122367 TaxID=1168545 RepID=A0A6G1IPL9_9PLEO|nr:peptidase S28 [Lentithecium fluviatile CBS 122367]